MFTTLVTAQELADHLDDPAWVVCDCRHDLADYGAGRRAYAQAHIPGARFVHLDEDLSGPKTGHNGRHPLPHPLTLALRAGALGIDSTTGTLEAGKAADVVVWSGDPFSVYSKAERVYNEGWLVFDRANPKNQRATDFNLGTSRPGVGQ